MEEAQEPKSGNESLNRRYLAILLAGFEPASLSATGFSRWCKDNQEDQPALSRLEEDLSMSSHVFHEIYLHLNWHTKNDQPLLTPDFEPLVHKFLQQRCLYNKGVYFQGIGGTENHVHLAINIQPFVCISDLVGDLKGSCSFEMNKLKGFKSLEWQRGFGAVSFGKKQLDWVLKYIAHQKEHHAKGTTHARLEKDWINEDGHQENGA